MFVHMKMFLFFFFQAEDGIRDYKVTGVQTCALPIFHADRIVTPTLFLCGDADFNVPLLNSEQMYQALRSLGRETELIIYPGESHGLDKPSHLRDRLGREWAGYGQDVKGAGATTTRG